MCISSKLNILLQFQWDVPCSKNLWLTTHDIRPFLYNHHTINALIIPDTRFNWSNNPQNHEMASIDNCCGTRIVTAITAKRICNSKEISLITVNLTITTILTVVLKTEWGTSKLSKLSIPTRPLTNSKTFASTYCCFYHVPCIIASFNKLANE